MSARRRQIVAGDLVPDLPICISSEVAPEIREFERGNTACANAYVQPLMQRYLERLAQRLQRVGYRGITVCHAVWRRYHHD